MVWGCMSWLGRGAMARVTGRIDAHQYVTVLERCLVLTIDKCAAEPDFPSRTKLPGGPKLLVLKG